MKKRVVSIYVEGQGEVNFLTQLIAHHFQKVFKVDEKKLKATFEDEQHNLVIQVFDVQSGHGGIDPTKIGKLLQEVEANKSIGIESFIILDADTPNHQPAGGFVKRKEYLENSKSADSFKFFLIPDHASDGNLETLLETMVSELGSPFYNCLKSYIQCLEKLSIRPIGLEKYDLTKAKFEWYVFNMMNEKKSNSTALNYGNNIWNLDAEGLKPLVYFLKNELKIN